jgi:hypothetical protein
LNGENQALMLQSSHWTHGKFFQFTRMAKMADLGSIAERQKFSRSRGKPTRRFRDCAPAPLMAGDGWEAECPNLLA